MDAPSARHGPNRTAMSPRRVHVGFGPLRAVLRQAAARIEGSFDLDRVFLVREFLTLSKLLPKSVALGFGFFAPPLAVVPILNGRLDASLGSLLSRHEHLYPLAKAHTSQ